MKLIYIPFVFMLLVGCHRSVDLKINGRASEYLKADIVKCPDGFRISTSMPKGNWAVRLVGDPYRVDADFTSPLPECRWVVPAGRLRDSRTFKLELCDPTTNEPKLAMELKPKLPGESFVEGTLRVIYEVVRPGIRY